MKKEVRRICYDEELKIEAYRFEGIMQPFPNHFHEYYVIGLVEDGKRVLSCRNREYAIRRGDILIFHPGDNHACEQKDSGTFDYRGFNISKEVMSNLVKEITGKEQLPGFSENVIHDEELTCYLKPLHQLVMGDFKEFKKEELLFFMLSLLIERYGKPFETCIPECREEIDRACEFLSGHYAENITLEQICNYVGLSKSTLLRAFTKSKGITPYRYLENYRISKAKHLLEQGATPLEAAMQTGYSDQSHFTNYFSMFIGLAPGVYRGIFRQMKGQEEESRGDEK